MSSPIHKYLFSPPPSPPRNPADRKHRPPPLTSVKSLVPSELLGQTELEGSQIRPRSPRTPQQRHFALDAGYPSGLPSRKSPASPGTFTLQVDDVEATPKNDPTTPKRKIVSEKTIASPQYLPNNVPSTPLPMPSTLPRPLIRLLFFASLILSSIMLLIYVPSARLPSLSAASVSRRLALAPDGRAYLDVDSPVTSWEEAKERDYVPPQIRATHMMKRAAPEDLVEREATPQIKPSRPTVAARPLPETHELLALQSYLLQSSYNVLPSSMNTQHPLDANVVLGFDADEEALDELVKEREDDVVVWYGGDGSHVVPHDLLALLSGAHGSSRKPSMISVRERPDLKLVLDILTRLHIPLDRAPIIMFGNTPVVADPDRLEEMRGSGQLAEMFANIGWVKTEEKVKKVVSGWKPKVAKVGKKEVTEVEKALDEVKRK